MPDNRKNADKSPKYPDHEIKKDIIRTTAECGYNKTAHVLAYLAAGSRKTAEMEDTLKFSRDFVNGQGSSVEILVHNPPSIKFMEGPQVAALDAGLPNKPSECLF
jgi:hypothetical protein